MRIESKVASVLWKLLLIVALSWGLLGGTGVFTGTLDEHFPRTFTSISGIFALLYFVPALFVTIGRSRRLQDSTFVPTMKYTATISLIATMLISQFMLSDGLIEDGQVAWHLVVLRYVVPIMALLDWLLFDVKGEMHWWGPITWVMLLVAYLGVVFLGVNVFGLDLSSKATAGDSLYPYAFMDPSKSSFESVARLLGVMILTFVVLGFVLVIIDHLMGRGNDPEPLPQGKHFRQQ